MKRGNFYGITKSVSLGPLEFSPIIQHAEEMRCCLGIALRAQLLKKSAWLSHLTNNLRLHIPHTIVVRLCMPRADVVILTSKTAGTVVFEQKPILSGRIFHRGRSLLMLLGPYHRGLTAMWTRKAFSFLLRFISGKGYLSDSWFDPT